MSDILHTNTHTHLPTVFENQKPDTCLSKMHMTSFACFHHLSKQCSNFIQTFKPFIQKISGTITDRLSTCAQGFLEIVYLSEGLHTNYSAAYLCGGLLTDADRRLVSSLASPRPPSSGVRMGVRSLGPLWARCVGWSLDDLSPPPLTARECCWVHHGGRTVSNQRNVANCIMLGNAHMWPCRTQTKELFEACTISDLPAMM